jgi:hypothetical protein
MSPTPEDKAREVIDGMLEKAVRHIYDLKEANIHTQANLSIEREDFDYAPFAQNGGIGKVHQVFGDRLDGILEEMNEALQRSFKISCKIYINSIYYGQEVKYENSEDISEWTKPGCALAQGIQV